MLVAWALVERSLAPTLTVPAVLVVLVALLPVLVALVLVSLVLVAPPTVPRAMPPCPHEAAAAVAANRLRPRRCHAREG